MSKIINEIINDILDSRYSNRSPFIIGSSNGKKVTIAYNALEPTADGTGLKFIVIYPKNPFYNNGLHALNWANQEITPILDKHFTKLQFDKDLEELLNE